MFEYQIVKVRGLEHAKVTMNEYAKEGWKVVSNALDYRWGHLSHNLLEREKIRK